MNSPGLVEKLLAGIKLTVIEILRYLPVSAGLSI